MAQIRENCLPVETLRLLIDYNPETGALIWMPRAAEFFSKGRVSAAHRANIWNTRYAGKPALAAPEPYGYGHGDIFDVRYKAHRVAWALHYGEWPDRDIDHINGDAADNRIDNLRLVTKQQNMRNQKFNAANSSGAMGVSWAKHRNKWSAQIKVAGRKIHLGLFSDFDAAVSARKAAERRYGFHANHGRRAA